MKSKIRVVFAITSHRILSLAKLAAEFGDEIREEAKHTPGIDKDFTAEQVSGLFTFEGDRRTFAHVAKHLIQAFSVAKIEPIEYSGDHADIIPWYMTYQKFIETLADYDTALSYFRTEPVGSLSVRVSNVNAFKPLKEAIKALRLVDEGLVGVRTLMNYGVKELKLAREVLDAIKNGPADKLEDE